MIALCGAALRNRLQLRAAGGMKGLPAKSAGIAIADASSRNGRRARSVRTFPSPRLRG